VTIINCVVSPLGIIQLADSYVTMGETVTDVKEKMFAIPVEHTGYVTTAGSYQVGGVPMNRWMPDFVKSFETSHPAPRSPASFADALKVALEASASEAECLEAGFLLHIAGYGMDGSSGVFRPEMHFVRNVYTMDDKGDYGDFRTTFQTSEDFWTRYSTVGDMFGYRAAIEGGGSIQFFNGLTSGRQALVQFGQAMFGVFRENWIDPTSPFNPPTTLRQLRDISKLIMEAVCVLAAESSSPAPSIGKPVISGLIQPPPNAVHMPGR